MKGAGLQVVAFFPSCDFGLYGGVQASAREAWQGIVEHVGTGASEALYYEPGSSKVRAVVRAMRLRRRRARLVLVWHLHLLKLLPLVDDGTSRVVLFLHGIEAWTRHGPVVQRLLRRVDLILSNSDHTWRRFVQCNPAFHDKSHRTVHLGAGTRLDTTLREPSSTPSVLMVGRLDVSEDYKGHRQMIDAWPLVMEHVPAAQLRVIGDGNLRRTLESVAGKRLPRHVVQFYGQASDAKKDDLLSQCRCLALPSRGEGFGLVYVEAMRTGRPCLVSNVDAGREVVNPPEAGLAVNPERPSEVADAVRRLLTPGTEWDGWSSRAQARYEANFTGERFRQRLASALFDGSG